MAIKFAGGFLPYFYKLDPDAFEGTQQIGQQWGLYVKVKNESLTLLKHEEHHVKQAYLTLAIIVALYFASEFFMMPWLIALAVVVVFQDFIPYVNFRKEAAAYAVSVSYGRELESAVSALSRHRYAGGDRALATAEITSSRHYKP